MLTGLVLADTQSGPALGNLVILALPLILLLVLFMTGRRRTKAVQQLQSSLVAGDEVVTTSGMHGRIVSIDEHAARLEVAPGVVVNYDRRAIGMRRDGLPGSGEAPATPTQDS